MSLFQSKYGILLFHLCISMKLKDFAAIKIKHWLIMIYTEM
ncbi:hypothetical protein VIBNIAM115_1380001 [Vibrio nigripulchritudo AM115]|nr:hypothetical protein VIBNIAM115_1380001 [Vibrio nigripulchritudo AM115]